MTSEHRAAFETTGVLRLPGFYAAEAVAPMADAVWADMATRLGVQRERPETWTTIRPGRFKRLTDGAPFSAIGSPDLARLADALLGEGAWTRPRHWGQPLVTLPAAQWDLPRVLWHFDLPGDDYRAPLPGLRLFTFLERVAPNGGGTLYIAGSHRLALQIAEATGPIPSANLRDVLKARHRWFSDLCAATGEETRRFIGEAVSLSGIDVSVEEMTGAPGDLIVMHPLMLHGVAHNASADPRLMLSTSVWRKGRRDG
jgi:hypothetical protein